MPLSLYIYVKINAPEFPGSALSKCNAHGASSQCGRYEFKSTEGLLPLGPFDGGEVVPPGYCRVSLIHNAEPRRITNIYLSKA